MTLRPALCPVLGLSAVASIVSPSTLGLGYAYGWPFNRSTEARSQRGPALERQARVIELPYVQAAGFPLGEPPGMGGRFVLLATAPVCHAMAVVTTAGPAAAGYVAPGRHVFFWTEYSRPASEPRLRP